MADEIPHLPDFAGEIENVGVDHFIQELLGGHEEDDDDDDDDDGKQEASPPPKKRQRRSKGDEAIQRWVSIEKILGAHVTLKDVRPKQEFWLTVRSSEMPCLNPLLWFQISYEGEEVPENVEFLALSLPTKIERSKFNYYAKAAGLKMRDKDWTRTTKLPSDYLGKSPVLKVLMAKESYLKALLVYGEAFVDQMSPDVLDRLCKVDLYRPFVVDGIPEHLRFSVPKKIPPEHEGTWADISKALSIYKNTGVFEFPTMSPVDGFLDNDHKLIAARKSEGVLGTHMKLFTVNSSPSLACFPVGAVAPGPLFGGRKNLLDPSFDWEEAKEFTIVFAEHIPDYIFKRLCAYGKPVTLYGDPDRRIVDPFGGVNHFNGFKFLCEKSPYVTKIPWGDTEWQRHVYAAFRGEGGLNLSILERWHAEGNFDHFKIVRSGPSWKDIKKHLRLGVPTPAGKFIFCGDEAILKSVNDFKHQQSAKRMFDWNTLSIRSTLTSTLVNTSTLTANFCGESESGVVLISSLTPFSLVASVASLATSRLLVVMVP
jgi:hypothetical protein